MVNPFLKQLSRIKKIVLDNGFNQFIVIDSQGHFVHQKMDRPWVMANLLLSIKRRASVLGKTTFKSFTITIKNHQKIIIFPIGKYCLGVVISDHIKNNPGTDNDLDNQINIRIDNILKTLASQKVKISEE